MTTNEFLHFSEVKNVYKPDILTCLANLSNDEVFTPPNIVNDILDMLPKELFESKDTKFLDPVCKSGVFLREIAKRLMKGLENIIKDNDERRNHIFTKQLFGMAITELTAQMSRRSLYCSKDASGKYSVVKFSNSSGNINFKTTLHTFKNGNCVFCGASEKEYGEKVRKNLESHAYEFIHMTDKQIKEMTDMKFDVIIGNPPYQLSDGGGTGSSAMPIYQKFITQAKKLNPRFLTMIVPSRWFTGGRGLDEFRDEMLRDTRLRRIHDFIDAGECFSGVEIKGGVCYFLWERDNRGECTVVSHIKDNISEMTRPLLENGCETFIRFNSAISLFRRIQSFNEASFSDIVSANDPFGFDVRVENSYRRVQPKYKLKDFPLSVNFYYNGWRTKGLGYIEKASIAKGHELIAKHKLLIPKAWGIGNISTDWLTPIFAKHYSCCTETYLVVGPFENEVQQKNCYSYMQTKFFHALVSLVKISQNTMKKSYSFVPMQDFNESWNDEKLYKKYSLSKDEISFIEGMIRPMDSNTKEELEGGEDE